MKNRPGRERSARSVVIAFPWASSPSYVQPRAQHDTTRIHEHRGLSEGRAEEIVRANASSAVLLSRLSTSIISSTLPRRRTEGLSTRAGRAATATTSRREPGGFEQDALIALRQRHPRARRPGLAAEVLESSPRRRRRSRGTSTLPMIRNMCGRSLASRPRALVRLLGSCPKVPLERQRTELLT